MLYIMRHGKTDWNANRRLQGRTDIPLNEEGRAMAVGAREAIAAIPLDVCYTSPLQRARETAELVLEGRDVPIVPDQRLIEMGFGRFEGTANCFQIPNCPINVLFQTPEQYHTPVEGGESLEALYQRTGEFLREVVYPQLEQGKHILIMGHGAMNSCIVCQVKGIPVERFWTVGLENCKLMQLL